MRIQNYTLALALTFICNFSNAQYFDVGGNLGIATYQGDLTPKNINASFGDTNFSLGVFGRLNVNDFIAFRLDFTQAKISANDQFARDNWRKNRNLNFTSNISELAFMGEINLLGFSPTNRRGRQRKISPFIFGGLAVFKFNPKTEYNGVWYDLQPLGTEGQGLSGGKEKYSLVQYSIPLGAGLKVAFNPRWTVSFDVGTRKTSTDYLDDVSGFYPDLELLGATHGAIAAELSFRTDEIHDDVLLPQPGHGRGDPKDRDWYIFSKITVSYNFIKQNKYYRNGKKGKRKKRKPMECPLFLR